MADAHRDWVFEPQVLSAGATGPDRQIVEWLLSLGDAKRRELGELLQDRGDFLGSQVLDDWIADHGGLRPWRYVLYGVRVSARNA